METVTGFSSLYAYCYSPHQSISEDYSLKKELYYCAVLQGKWEKAESIFARYPDMVRNPLTPRGDTALHVAINAKNIDFVRQLVNLAHFTPEDLQILNADGITAFCMAAILGNDDCLNIMTQKNENLPLIRGHDNMLPVHIAAFIGHKNIVRLLISDNHMLEKMAPADIQQLFLLTIDRNMYDVAIELYEKLSEPKTNLFDKYPIILATARDNQEKLTALHLLAQKPSSDESKYNNNNASSAQSLPLQCLLLIKLWKEIEELEYEQVLDLVTKPSVVLFDAVKSGNNDVLACLSMNLELFRIKDCTNGQNLLHIAALYRRENIVDYILSMTTANLLQHAVDNDNNNVLHLAATMSPQNEASASSRPSIQMLGEIEWFKKVEKGVPPGLRTMKNKQGKTPMDVFRAHQEKLSKQLKYSAIKIANSGMVVATLIATVAFAAALTTPGDDKSNAWFIVYILTNGVAVFTSSASIISFLSIFTSSKFTENEYAILLHPKLILGLMLLFISIATMVTAFVATSFLIFASKSKWVAYAMASLAPLPILLFPLLHVGLFIDYYYYYRCHRLLRI